MGKISFYHFLTKSPWSKEETLPVHVRVSKTSVLILSLRRWQDFVHEWFSCLSRHAREFSRAPLSLELPPLSLNTLITEQRGVSLRLGKLWHVNRVFDRSTVICCWNKGKRFPTHAQPREDPGNDFQGTSSRVPGRAGLEGTFTRCYMTLKRARRVRQLCSVLSQVSCKLSCFASFQDSGNYKV